MAAEWMAFVLLCAYLGGVGIAYTCFVDDPYRFTDALAWPVIALGAIMEHWR